jgi:hypothetical protein
MPAAAFLSPIVLIDETTLTGAGVFTIESDAD